MDSRGAVESPKRVFFVNLERSATKTIRVVTSGVNIFLSSINDSF